MKKLGVYADLKAKPLHLPTDKTVYRKIPFETVIRKWVSTGKSRGRKGESRPENPGDGPTPSYRVGGDPSDTDLRRRRT